MIVLLCMVSERNCSQRRKKIYVETFQKIFPIAMGQLSEEVYYILAILEPENLNISRQMPMMHDEQGKWCLKSAKKHMFLSMCPLWTVYIQPFAVNYPQSLLEMSSEMYMTGKLQVSR